MATIEIVYSEAHRAADRQTSDLDELRNRTGQVLGVGSLAFTILVRSSALVIITPPPTAAGGAFDLAYTPAVGCDHGQEAKYAATVYLGPRGWMGRSWWDYGLDNAYCNRCHERIWFTAGGERLTPDSQLAADRSDPPDGR